MGQARGKLVKAPQKFADWLAVHEHVDPQFGYVYRYHPRSDAHSIALCQFVLEDLLSVCRALRVDAEAARVVFGINYKYQWERTGKRKTLDLAIGIAESARETPRFAGVIHTGKIRRVLIACEAKTVMTEHGKSQPRIFDELGSSHEIVHQGDKTAIAGGITVVNIAERFISPLRQKSRDQPHISKHNQPHVTERKIQHLRGLPIREGAKGSGFDAYANIVVNCDNEGAACLWTRRPAPQRGDPDHYDTFLRRISEAYAERFAK